MLTDRRICVADFTAGWFIQKLVFVPTTASIDEVLTIAIRRIVIPTLIVVLAWSGFGREATLI